MTDYWVSTKKHYCETCNCWISGHKVNIKNHEKSARHLENFKRLISESFKRREQETKEKEFIEKELRKLDNVEKNYLANLRKNEKLAQSDSSNKTNMHNSDNKSYENWILMIHEDTGCLVFFNKINNQITYEKPKDFFGKLPDQQSFSEQNGWYRYFDYNSNNFYYYNINNKDIIWQYSLSTINSFINYIKMIEDDKNKNLNNITGNLKQNIMPANLSNQMNFNSNIYHINYASNFGFNNNSLYNSFNLANLQESSNLQNKNYLKIDHIEKEQKKEKNKIQLMVNSNNNINNNINNVKNINNCKKINEEFSTTSYDKKDENIKELKDSKVDISHQTCKIETEGEQYFDINKTDAINEGHKFDNQEVVEGKQIKNNLDIEKKKKILNINISSKKTSNTFLDESDKKKRVEDKKKDSKDINYVDLHGENDKCEKDENENTSMPGAWEIVQDKQINIISDENIEEFFYNIKSKEEIEKEEISRLEENIRYEYSGYNEFYIKKKEIENDDLYLNQEFQFVSKPIYKKAIDKNLNKKVEFARRNIKTVKNKKKF